MMRKTTTRNVMVGVVLKKRKKIEKIPNKYLVTIVSLGLKALASLSSTP